jgi:amino acid transporter
MATMVDGVPPQSMTKPTLVRSVTWKSSFVVSLGAALLIVTSLGAIAGDLGPASIFVWSLVVVIGILQCFMIAEMASMFPNKSGGTAVYSHEAFKKWPFIGAIANWGYWLGWVPVIPVNLIVAAGYLKVFFPHLSDSGELYLAIGISLALYGSNYLGLKPGIWSSTVMAICSICPLVVITVSPVFLPHLFHAANVFPFVPTGGSWHSGKTWMLIWKDLFVALWSAYGIECASTTIAELKDPHKDAPKAMLASSIAGFFSYSVVPFVMLGIVGVSVLTQDASVAFLPAAQAIFGHIGGYVVSIMLITALLLGVQTTIIGSSRCMFEMTHDGQMIKQFGSVNKYGVPVGSMYVDLGVTLAMLILFRANVVTLIAASNVGYLSVFLVLIPAYIVLRYTHADTPRSFKLPGIFIPIAVLITLFNIAAFVIGGPQWDASPVATPVLFGHTVTLTVMNIGWTLMLAIVPFYLWRVLIQDKAGPSKYDVAIAGGLPELLEGQDDLGGRREVIHHEEG